MPTALKAAEPTRCSDTSARHRSGRLPGVVCRPGGAEPYRAAMKKLVLLAALIYLAKLAAKKAQHV